MKNAHAIEPTGSLAVPAVVATKHEVRNNPRGQGLVSPFLITKVVFYGYAFTLIGLGFFMQDVAQAPLPACIMFYFLGGGCAVIGWHSKRFCQRIGQGSM